MTLTLHALMDWRSRTVPDAVAVTTAGASLSHGELARRAAALTRQLRAHGLGAGSMVSLRLPAGADLAIAVRGVLGAGASFVVLDPSWPARGDAMLDRPALTIERRYGSRGDSALDHSRPVCVVAEADPAASGLALHDGDLTGALLVEYAALNLGPGDTVLHRSPPHEAFGVLELLLAMLSGARLAVPEVCDHGDIAVAVEVMTEQHVSHSWLPAPMLRDALGLSSLSAFRMIRAGFSHRAVWTTPDLDAQTRAFLEARTSFRLRPLAGDRADSEVAAELADLLCDLGSLSPADTAGPGVDPPEPSLPRARPAGADDPKTLEAVLACWGEVLGDVRIPPGVDFFAAGGSSVTAVVATELLSTRLSADLPIDLIFRHRMPSDYAAAVHLITTDLRATHERTDLHE